MNIAILSNNSSANCGWGVITLNYCKELYQKGINFTLFLPNGHAPVDVPWSKKIIYSLPSMNKGSDYYFSSVNIARMRLMNISTFDNFDIIHSLFAIPLSMVAYRASIKYDIKFILGAQGTYGVQPFLGGLSRFIFQKILDRAELLIVPSSFTRRSILSF